MQKYKSREEVPDKYKWDLTDFFKSDKDFEQNYKKCQKMVSGLKKYVGCTKDANKLYEFLTKDIETVALLENLYVYAYLINDQELGNNTSIERKSKTEDLFNDYELITNFFNPELLKLDKDSYKKLYKDNNNLKEFKASLDMIYRSKKHILDEEKESIITELSNALDNYDDLSSTMLNSEHDYGTIIIDGEEEQITPTNLSRLLKNKNRNIRKEAREKYNKVLGNYGVSSAQFLNGYVKGSIVDAKLHHYKSPWEAKLFSLNMPNKAYETLVNTVEENVGVLQRYFKILKKALKLDELYQYDLNLDMAESNKEYSIESAQELILKAVEPLGKEYVGLFKKIFDKHYIDYASYPSKCSGGYSFSTLDNDSRILLSYNYDLDSISTIAHEGGHNVHHQLVSKNNPLQYREISNLMAEVASLTNECLLSNYLAHNGSDAFEKISGIANILGVFISNLFGAVREGKIETDFYNHVLNGNTITKEYMNELTYSSLENYYGKEVILDEYSKYSWMRRSHYYMNYYLYNYAFCISVAASVAYKITSGDKNMLDKYMKYLSTGSNIWPIDAFKILDIDLTNKSVYENAIKYFDSLLDDLEKIIGGEKDE